MWLSLQGHGQPSSEADAAAVPAPASQVMDQSGFFREKPRALGKISADLQKLKQDHGFMVYLVVEPVFFGTTPHERAAQLSQQWLPGGDGLVIVFESDSGNIGVGRDLDGDLSAQAPVVPSFQSAAMINRAVAAVDLELKDHAFLESLMRELAGELDRYFEGLDAPAPVERSLRMGMLALGTLSLLGLVAIGIGALIRHSSMASAARFRFPEVDTRERLGAPCGGSVTTHRFARPGGPPP
jgi:hypothetical protein